jgi:hypothetical protein
MQVQLYTSINNARRLTKYSVMIIMIQMNDTNYTNECNCSYHLVSWVCFISLSSQSIIYITLSIACLMMLSIDSSRQSHAIDVNNH